MSRSRPLLSICIPTFRRAEWLRSCLHALAPQVERAGDLVELIVADNHSEDHTPEVVEWASALGPIRYHRHPRNIGSMRNVYALVNDLARGEFVWVLGNDDLAREDAVERVLAVLERRPELDYVYVNYNYWYPSEEEPTHLLSADEFPTSILSGNPDLQDRYVERVSELVAGDPACFTPFYCSVMRRPVARRAYEMCVQGEAWDSLENAVPQSLIVAQELLDKPAWYIGYPCIVASYATTWGLYRPMYVLAMLPELYDRFESAGARREDLDAHRRKMLSYDVTVGYVLKVLTQPDTPMPADFSLLKFIWKHRRFKELWMLLFAACKSAAYTRLALLPDPAFKSLRWLWRKQRRVFAALTNLI